MDRIDACGGDLNRGLGPRLEIRLMSFFHRQVSARRRLALQPRANRRTAHPEVLTEQSSHSPFATRWDREGPVPRHPRGRGVGARRLQRQSGGQSFVADGLPGFGGHDVDIPHAATRRTTPACAPQRRGPARPPCAAVRRGLAEHFHTCSAISTFLPPSDRVSGRVNQPCPPEPEANPRCSTSERPDSSSRAAPKSRSFRRAGPHGSSGVSPPLLL